MSLNRIVRDGDQRGSILVVALLVMVLLSLLGMALLTVGGTEHNIAANAAWYEGTLMAADASINQSLSQLSANPDNSRAAVPVTTIAGQYTYRSGTRAAGAPQEGTYVGSRVESGYAIGSGTGYNAAGWVFHVYQFDATGEGPRSSARELQAQAEYGPVAK